MYLKALEIQGFKSFPDKTTLRFEREITAIVGPNGSGKSNISDALLWVMGEQRSKALRGGKMEDVVFGGTEKRSPMGFAQVSLVLDNSGHLFDLDVPEVVITRRYYRTGESEYYLNRENVRLRDVTGLLMDTGLGRDGYSVIGQGRIAEIVSARSADRREVFEEAAGISRYRSRKEEAERKLERTEDNLLRVGDKISELELQIGPLKKQAETAKKYLVLRDEQRGLEISLWMEKLDRLAGERAGLDEAYENARGSLEDARGALEALYAAGERVGAEMRECDLTAERLRASRSAAEAAAAERGSAAAVMTEALAHDRQSVERLRAEMTEQSDRTERLRTQRDGHLARAAELERALAEQVEADRALQREAERNAAAADEARQGLAALVAEENAAGDGLSRCEATRAALGDRRADLDARTSGLDAELDAARERQALLHTQRAEAEQALRGAKEAAETARNQLNGHRLLLGGKEQAVRDLTAALNRVTVDKRSAEGRARMLSEMEKDYEGMGKAVKSVMRASERGTLRGVHGPVANLISVPERFALAVETALGGAMQHIVVDSQAVGKAAIEYLKRSDGGRATFLPIDTIRPQSPGRLPAGEPGFLGVAAELVQCEADYTNIISNLLGRTVVAETLGDAVRLSKRSDNRLRIVTLDGQLINAGGSMTGGSSSRGAGILSRANELRQLQAKCTQLAEAEREQAAKLAEAERALAGTRYAADRAAEDLNAATEVLHRRESELNQCTLMLETLEGSVASMERERRSLSDSGAALSAQLAELETERERLTETLAELRASIAERTGGQTDFERIRAELAERLSALRAERAAMEQEREGARRSAGELDALIASLAGDSVQRERNIAELLERCRTQEAEIAASEAAAAERRREAEDLGRELTALNARKLSLEGERTRRDREAQDKNREILDLQSVCARYEQKKQAAEMEEKQLVDKLWENYELSRTAARQQAVPLADAAAAGKRVTELRREISRLGHVNVGAIEQYEQLSERYGFLTGQRDDIERAKRDLMKIIADITGEMKEIFLREFAAIDAAFREVFLELFGGGKARLELEDPEDPLGCGIEIKVQPPGKAVTTISLLSGGEKSFVAICLYFAIMRVRPTPFCIMDEIDAALDEANVERYARYMRTLSDRTQFITITHHRATMEEADVLYGVTMQEKGVTTVLSIDLEEAERTAG